MNVDLHLERGQEHSISAAVYHQQHANDCTRFACLKIQTEGGALSIMLKAEQGLNQFCREIIDAATWAISKAQPDYNSPVEPGDSETLDEVNARRGHPVGEVSASGESTVSPEDRG